MWSALRCFSVAADQLVRDERGLAGSQVDLCAGLMLLAGMGVLLRERVFLAPGWGCCFGHGLTLRVACPARRCAGRLEVTTLRRPGRSQEGSAPSRPGLFE